MTIIKASEILVVMIIRWNSCPIKSSKYFSHITGPDKRKRNKNTHFFQIKKRILSIGMIFESEVAGLKITFRLEINGNPNDFLHHPQPCQLMR